MESARKLENNTEVTKNETQTSEHILANNIYQQPHNVKPELGPLAAKPEKWHKALKLIKNGR